MKKKTNGIRNFIAIFALLHAHLHTVETRGLGIAANEAAAKVDFENGIKASFFYFYRPAASPTATLAAATSAAAPGLSQYNAYIAANATNGLVSYNVATTGVPLMTT